MNTLSTAFSNTFGEQLYSPEQEVVCKPKKKVKNKENMNGDKLSRNKKSGGFMQTTKSSMNKKTFIWDPEDID